MRKFDGDTLLVATHNKGKLEEIAAMFQERGLKVLSNSDFGLGEPEETETTFVGKARIKAHAAAKATGQVALADDSGVCVIDLDGAPGVYTADWTEVEGGRDFMRGMTRVYEELLASGAPAPWKAYFASTLVIAWPDGHDKVFEGRVDGQIVWPPRGTNGHGYDPIFQPEGSDLTFGEMEANEKNSMSHRARAFEKLRACFM